jgi:hypothetical protein
MDGIGRKGPDRQNWIEGVRRMELDERGQTNGIGWTNVDGRQIEGDGRRMEL